jgi:hypothetical protein
VQRRLCAQKVPHLDEPVARFACEAEKNFPVSKVLNAAIGILAFTKEKDGANDPQPST